jgi:hypothetical protein
MQGTGLSVHCAVCAALLHTEFSALRLIREVFTQRNTKRACTALHCATLHGDVKVGSEGRGIEKGRGSEWTMQNAEGMEQQSAELSAGGGSGEEPQGESVGKGMWSVV